MERPRPASLWFERLYSSLRLPFWAGAFIFGCIIFLGILVASALVTGLMGFMVDTGIIYFVPFAMVASLFSQSASRAARRKIEQLKDYAGTLSGDREFDLKPLYSIRNTLVTYVTLLALIQPVYILYGLPPTLTLAERIVLSSAFFYWNLFINTFVWVWAYALYSTNRIGGLSLNLKPFTEDRSLGLKPFGRFSLQLTGLYVGLFAIIVLPNIAVGFSSLPLLALFAALFLSALIFFLLPLIPLRRQLLLAKRELLRRIGTRYTRAFERIDSSTGGEVDQKIVNELTAIDKIQRDVQQIYTWPFDVGIVVRLSVIILSVTAAVLARIIQVALQL